MLLRFATAALTLLLVLSTPWSASAQTNRGPLAVLGFSATPSEDEAARTLTSVVEQQARRLGFTLVQNTPSLEQALALAGCEEVFMDDCMPQIVDGLNATRVIYGRVSRNGDNVRFEISLYETSTRRHRSADRGITPEHSNQPAFLLVYGRPFR